jgi:hypothetical protein
MLRLVTISLVILTLAACGNSSDGGGAGGDAKPTLGPDKASTIALLRTLEASVRAGDVVSAMATLYPLRPMTMEEAKKRLPMLIEKEGITQNAIDILALKATFGPLGELWPERGAYWAKKAKVDVKDCYGLKADPAEIAVHWSGMELRFIRIDDLHKLRP